jgi:peptidylamidoglycolate lyase
MDVIIGHNGFEYKVDKKWSRADFAKYPVNDCHEMVMASNGLLYMLTNETKNNVLIYNKDGEIKGSWGNSFPGGHGLSIHNENGTEFLYITDTVRHKVFKVSLSGELIFEIPYPKEIDLYQSEEEYKPTETLIAANGDIYVTDGYGHQFVIQYNTKGEYIRHWGGKGTGNDNFDCVHGIAFDGRNTAQPSLLITSRNQNAFKRFTMDGKYLSTINIPGSFVCRPVVNCKNIYAAVFRSGDNQNFGSGYITILNEHDQVISSPGASQPIYHNQKLIPQRQTSKAFIHPHDVCVDDDENLYIPQWNSDKSYPLKLERVR